MGSRGLRARYSRDYRRFALPLSSLFPLQIFEETNKMFRSSVFRTGLLTKNGYVVQCVSSSNLCNFLLSHISFSRQTYSLQLQLFAGAKIIKKSFYNVLQSQRFSTSIFFACWVQDGYEERKLRCW